MVIDQLVVVGAYYLHAPSQGGLPSRKYIVLLVVFIPLLQIGTTLLQLIVTSMLLVMFVLLVVRYVRRRCCTILIVVVVHGHLLVLVGDAWHSGGQLVPLGLLSHLSLHRFIGRFGHLLRTLVLPDILLRRCGRFSPAASCRLTCSSIGFCVRLVLNNGAFFRVCSCTLSGCRARVTLGLDLAHRVDLLRVHLLDILW